MNKEDSKEFFIQKNARRKSCRGTSQYADGREQRRQLAPGGAFGELSPNVFNKCCVGTTHSGKEADGSNTDD